MLELGQGKYPLIPSIEYGLIIFIQISIQFSCVLSMYSPYSILYVLRMSVLMRMSLSPAFAGKKAARIR